MSSEYGLARRVIFPTRVTIAMVTYLSEAKLSGSLDSTFESDIPLKIVVIDRTIDAYR